MQGSYRIFGKGQNSDLEAKLGQNKLRIWFGSPNNGFFVKGNERICFNYRLQWLKLIVTAETQMCARFDDARVIVD